MFIISKRELIFIPSTWAIRNVDAPLKVVGGAFLRDSQGMVALASDRRRRRRRELQVPLAARAST